jgi:hypothetical protein
LKTKEVKVAGIGEVKNIKADDGVSQAISVWSNVYSPISYLHI